MEWWNQFVRGIGTANAPFGFAPVDSPSQGQVDPAYNAGMQMLGNVGMGMLASGEKNPMTALGKSYLVASQNAQQQNRDQYTASRLLEEADAKKQERAQAEEERKRRQDFIRSLPPDQQMKAMSIPGYLEKLVEATDPAFQQPQEQKRYNVGGALVDENGNVIYQGQGDSNSVTMQIEERRAAAEQLGLTPNDPAYKSYILTGKMPREDQAPLTATDKKAILEADDAVMTNQTVIDQLNSVITPDASGLSLNDRAGSGFFAGTQAFMARNDPTGLFDDAKGQATTDLENIVLGQALTSLKSIFGSAPTEGERQILIDLQASIDKDPKERKPIIERAIRLAQQRLAFNKQRAEGLRGQTYYKPGGGGPITTPDGYTIEEVPDGQ